MPVTPSNVPGPLKEVVELQFGRTIVVSNLFPSPPVADATSKLLVTDSHRRRLAVILCGRAIAAGLVNRNVRRAIEARGSLGPRLGSYVLTPLSSGDADGVTYALYRYARPARAGRLRGAIHRRTLLPHILSWLQEVVVATRQAPTALEIEQQFAFPLERLIDNDALDDHTRSEARCALDRLISGQWQPCHVLTHYDFWTGNLLIPAGPSAVADPPRFLVIDWPGAVVRGYGVFDLIRLAGSMRVPPRALQRELRRHCAALGCEPIDARSHLLAALAFLGLHLGHFPMPRYAAMSQRCMSLLAAAEQA